MSVFPTSGEPRVRLPHVADGAVRSLAVVAATESTHTIDRQRALDQLKTMAATGDTDAATMVEALKDLVIENDSTTEQFDSSIPRTRVGFGNGVWKRN
jgi:hypothetical protein